jgi:hypothetical protein
MLIIQSRREIRAIYQSRIVNLLQKLNQIMSVIKIAFYINESNHLAGY